jgi:hypothetical protein
VSNPAYTNIVRQSSKVVSMDTFDRTPSREDYLSAPPSYAPKMRMGKPASKAHMRSEERLGSLMAGAGIIWAVYLVTHNFAGSWNLDTVIPGPLPLCGIGILIWLHAKWRRSATRD